MLHSDPFTLTAINNNNVSHCQCQCSLINLNSLLNMYVIYRACRNKLSQKFKKSNAQSTYLFIIIQYLCSTIHKLSCSNAHTDNKTKYKNDK